MRLVIPHRNTPELLLRCLETLAGATTTPIHEVVVVDDASSEPLPELSPGTWHSTAIALPRRVGFTGAVNAGLRHVLSEGADFIGILNSDLEFVREGEADWLSLCTESLEADHSDVPGKRNAIVSPMLVGADGDTIQWAGEATTLTAPAQHRSGSRRAGDCGKRSFVRWHTFGCVVIRWDALREVGLLDPNLRMICSDSDWCLRARWFGWRCVYEPAAVVKHVQSQTIQREREKDAVRFDGQLFQDQQLFLSKWTGRAFQSLDMGPIEQWLEPL